MFANIWAKWLKQAYVWVAETNNDTLNDILLDVKENNNTWDYSEYSEGYFEYRLACHKENLRKGGLIPQVEKYLHNLALQQICEETPNVALPRSRTVKLRK